MFVTAANIQFRVVPQDSYEARVARDRRLIKTSSGVAWHAGATRATGQAVSEPVVWMAYPGHCAKCPPVRELPQ